MDDYLYIKGLVWDDHYGYGLVNAYGAVLEAIKYKQQ